MKSFICRNKVRKINRAVKIRICPNAEQRVQIEKTIGCSDLSITVCLLTKWNIIKKKKRC
ncbi:hypothetical protein DW723_18205 [Blautia obeum]|uniref:Transposase putative helix-turn-helix domain-containing protein n=1 Tax=Blautia obeum TaxID=40520 RepID=A0A414K4B3_9FIRM|nr:hypothetical protein DW723_18205 [Blautia obeum]